jgi:hypothetical protein
MATHFVRPPARDKLPAFIGLVAGGAVIFLILFGVVKWTNTLFEGHGATPAAGAARH